MSSAAFPKILHIGDRQLSTLFEGEVEITEKVDGSQFGFGKENGILFCRSKGKEQDLDNPDMMFEKAVEYIKSISNLVPDNMTFWGEWLNKPKHNSLAYDRTPRNGIALFGVYDPYTNVHFGMDVISMYADLFGIDSVPLLFKGEANASGVLEMVNNRVSYLGGQNIEGVVVKAYKPWLFLGQIPMTVMSGKYVTESFKEVHHENWKKENTGKGRLEVCVGQYKSTARWNKAVQHLRDDGLLTGTPSDIGALIKGVREDIEVEEKEHIKEQLWDIYKNDFLQAATNGMPQWYKEQLVLGEINDKIESGEEPEEVIQEDGKSDTQGVRQPITGEDSPKTKAIS